MPKKPIEAISNIKLRDADLIVDCVYEDGRVGNAGDDPLNALLGETFSDKPIRFERCAGRISEMLLGQVTKLDITRPSRDGGRDALGLYRVGRQSNGIEIEFAIEAKCYGPQNPVGVKEISRLISRLRHRQFGVLVTTSYLGAQAYQEIKDDAHPVIVVSGRDIAELLERKGLGEKSALMAWLAQF